MALKTMAGLFPQCAWLLISNKVIKTKGIVLEWAVDEHFQKREGCCLLAARGSHMTSGRCRRPARG